MKTIFVLLFVSLSFFLRAQVFFEISKGYAFSLQKSELAFPYFNGSYDIYQSKDPIYNQNNGSHYYYIDHTIIKKSPAKVNFGSGDIINCSIGYYIGKYFGIALYYSLNYKDRYQDENKTYYTLTSNNYYGYPLSKHELEFSFDAKSKLIALQCILQYPTNVHLNPFVKFGISQSTHEVYVSRTSIFNVNNQIETDGFKEKYYGNNSLGYIFSIGTKYNIEDFAFSFECRFLLDTYSPSNCYSYDYYSISPYSISQNNLPTDHEVVLEDYSNGGNYKENNDSPFYNEKRYKSKFSFSTFSLNIGVHYTFRFKKKDKETAIIEQ